MSLKPKSSFRALFQLLIFFLLLITTVISFMVLKSKYLAERERYRSGDLLVYASNEKVLGIASDSSEVQINFGQQITTSSPLIFGGAQLPDTKGNQIWNELSDVGMTMVRKDFFLEYSVPKTTIEDYLNNKNDIQNPANWNTNYINNLNQSYSTAQARGMKVIGIVSYAPPWLTYDGTQHGVPKNWDVYQDIVKKIYRIHRNQLDYVEIWNEPSYRLFLKPEGSGLSREQAYLQIFKHAAEAIREVDAEINDGKSIPIGGPVDHKSDSLIMLQALLSDSELRKELDFISFHHYGPNPPNFSSWRNIMNRYGVRDLPIFLTEWNYSSEEKSKDAQLVSYPAISYTGKMLISFLNEGVTGANYYSIFSRDPQFNRPGHGNLAFYEVVEGRVKLLPQSKTWRILSQTLGLGEGDAEVYQSSAQYQVPTVGFRNSEKQYGIAVTNLEENTQAFEVTVQGVSDYSHLEVQAYLADRNNDGSSQISSTVLPIQSGKTSYTILAPAHSVVGLKLRPTGQLIFRWNSLLRSLYQL